MKALLRPIVVLLCALAWAAPAYSEEPFEQFLRAMQDRRYGEQSLDFIESIKDREDLPVELKQSLDLERSRSLKLAASEAYDPKQRDARLAQSKELLEKFLKDAPSHPAVGDALLAFGDEALQAGIMALGQARGSRDPAEQKGFMDTARTKLGEAKQQFTVATTRLKERLDKFPKPAEGKPLKPKEFEARSAAEIAWLEARFYVAQIDYLLAQTYGEKDAQRKKLLTDSGKVFDSMFQEFRGSRVAFLSHMWHGKTIEELGDTQTAFDVYDEVLVLDSESTPGKEPPVSDAPLLGQAELFRLRLLAKTKDPNDVILEGEEWMKDHRTWQKTAVYQGVALEVAKAAMKLAERVTGGEQVKLYRELLTTLNAIGKVDTEYKHEALVLRRDVMEKIGSDASMSPDEALALANAAAGEKDYDEAIKLYEQARDAAIKNKNDKLKTDATSGLTKVRFRVALDKYEAGDMDATLKLAGRLLGDSPNDPLAESASGLAIAAALALFTSATPENRDEALKKLLIVANYPVDKWPDSATADEGRMALAQAHVLKGESDKAIAMLEGIRMESRHYASALNLSSRILWKRYLDGKKAPDAAEKQDQLAETRDNARLKLQTSFDLQGKVRPAGEAKMPQTLFETQLLLAEVTLEQQKPADAAPLFQGLVAELQKNKPAAIDNSVLRTFIGAVRSNIASGQIALAGDAALALIGISDDTAQLNSVLVDFAKLLTMELKKLDAVAIQSEGGDAAAQAQAKTQAESIRQALGKVAAQLATRQQLTVQQLVFLGDTCALVAQNDKAREVYQRVTALIEKDPAAKETAGAAITRVRAQLISLLRSEAKYEEANKQVDELIAAHPTALEPLMEKGRILQSWAQRDASKYDECVQHWTKVRLLLGRMRTRPPEYYEVLYNAAACLVVQARKESDPEKAQQAEQMLKATLTLNSKLSGPDMVAKYEQLAKQAGALKGLVKPKTTASATPKKPAASSTTAKKPTSGTTTTKKKATAPATTTAPATAPNKKTTTKTTAAAMKTTP